MQRTGGERAYLHFVVDLVEPREELGLGAPQVHNHLCWGLVVLHRITLCLKGLYCVEQIVGLVCARTDMPARALPAPNKHASCKLFINNTCIKEYLHTQKSILRRLYPPAASPPPPPQRAQSPHRAPSTAHLGRSASGGPSWACPLLLECWWV